MGVLRPPELAGGQAVIGDGRYHWSGHSEHSALPLLSSSEHTRGEGDDPASGAGDPTGKSLRWLGGPAGQIKWRRPEVVRRPSVALTSPENLTVHEIKQLKKKKHVAPRIPPDHHEDVFATSSDSDFELEAGVNPTWVTKLTDKVKKTFSLQAHVQKKLYVAHVNERLARRTHIQIMWALNLQDDSGSKKIITLEEN
ncbi:hypothetical protein D1007_30265 [Hordeum vulgare]|nr:hypothetical protein D1007_30265 [Hordeum vulgare]